MPIVTHTINQTIQADGRISYILRMYDQDGAERLQTGLLPSGFDVSAFVVNQIAETDIQLAEDEFRALVGL